jgi:16S rRNA (cytidine1402-2'-O)-methyltransferase
MQNFFFFISTPIGNIKDMSLRIINIIYNADIILIESFYNFLKLSTNIGLNIHGKKLILIRNYSTHKLIKNIACSLKNHMYIVLMSDAGQPSISDPGNLLVNSLIFRFPFNIVPGNSALTASITGCGLKCNHFYYMGFLNKHAYQKININNSTKTLIIYESSIRLNSLLRILFLQFGAVRFSVCREITKIYETLHYGILGYFLYPWLICKGEVVIIIEIVNIL